VCVKNMKIPHIIGSEYTVNTIHNQTVRYLNLDNAATTPSFRPIMDRLSEFMEIYGSVHRGSGQKSQMSTAIYEGAISVILGFLGVTQKEYALTPTHNTTSAINKIARMLNISADDTIFLSEFEHSANDLPWRKGAKIIRIPADESGQFCMNHFEEALKVKNRKGKKFVAVSGASNITGALTPVHEIAMLAHSYGANVLVDAAQLVAHREINLQGNRNRDDAIDFVCFSGHKMYAPFGGGVLVGKRELMEQLTPDDTGGGSVDFVMNDSYDLAKNFSKRTTAGTPSVMGIVSMALSCNILRKEIGFKYILAHEQEILDRAKRKISVLHGIKIYCDLDYNAKKKCAIITFNVEGVHPNLIAARLGHEFGIGVRQGAICQFSFVAKLLGLNAKAVQVARQEILAGHTDRSFGIVRASFGLGNIPEDVDRFADALIEIVKTPEKSKNYFFNTEGEFWPIGKPRLDVASFFNTQEGKK